jgi:hypothetical protein
MTPIEPAAQVELSFPGAHTEEIKHTMVKLSATMLL